MDIQSAPGDDINCSHPMWATYRNIRARCYSVIDPAYPNYGGRGIGVDPAFDSFEKFAIWISENLGPRPAEHSLDRIDNDGDYAPGNLRWATRIEQMSHTRRSHMITYGGKTQTMSQWAREVGIPRGTIFTRLKRGYPIERALSAQLQYGG